HRRYRGGADHGGPYDAKGDADHRIAHDGRAHNGCADDDRAHNGRSEHTQDTSPHHSPTDHNIASGDHNVDRPGANVPSTNMDGRPCRG
ncbi:MAG: hypothetical protein KJN63_12230, partial [Acidimicrobiia bacterium]|nr:hypothetical protein [Acidimicrobiia bacterium]